MLGGSGHRDVAVDRPFDAGSERGRVDEHHQVELEFGGGSCAPDDIAEILAQMSVSRAPVKVHSCW